MDNQQQATLERELDNWGAWARSGQAGPGRCGSAESMYVGPRDDGARLDALIPDPIRVSDAERIERGVLKLRTWTQRRLLVLAYVHQAPNTDMAALLNVRPMLVRPAVIVVLEQLQYLLDHTHGSVLRERSMPRGLHSVG